METEWIEFVETVVFTKRVQQLGLEEALRTLQVDLVKNPEAGAVDNQTGGLRKVRMADPSKNKGKRGGIRVLYLWLSHRSRIYFLYLYPKGEQEALTKAQKDALKAVVLRIKAASA